MHASLVAFEQKLQSGSPAKVVMFGDSITWGSQIDPAYDHEIVFHKQWRDELIARYPAATIEVINKGVPGNKIADALARVQKDVLSEAPDLVVVEFGINDCWAGLGLAEDFESGLSELVQLLKARVNSVILMTANMMNYAVTPEALKMAWFAQTSADAQTSGWMDEYMERVRRVAAQLKLPLADSYAKYQHARKSGVDTDALLVNGANHPNAEGHRLLADALLELFPTG